MRSLMFMFRALNGYTSISFAGCLSIEKIRHVLIVSIIGSFRNQRVKHNFILRIGLHFIQQAV